MRNWHPFLHDTLAEMSRAGVRRAIGFIMAAQGSYSSCQQYKENVRDARKAIVGRGPAPTSRSPTPAAGTRTICSSTRTRVTCGTRSRGCPTALRSRARLIFTAHSIPTRLRRPVPLSRAAPRVVCEGRRAGGACRLGARLSEPQRPARGSVARARRRRLSARRRARMGWKPRCSVRSASSAITSRCCTTSITKPPASPRDLGVALTRPSTVNDDPLFLDMMAEVVLSVVQRHATGRPLPLAS